MINIKTILTSSLRERCIFHSEADFQHHLAWHIHKDVKTAKLRLEYPFPRIGSDRLEYCDILLRSPEKVGLELKYKTKAVVLDINGEDFRLRNHSARDTGRYDFLKDLSRLEQWLEQGRIDYGFVVMLSNDCQYWTIPQNGYLNDREFRIHNSTVSGILSWGERTSPNTMKSRKTPITLRNEYRLEWNDIHNSDFRYLLLKIDSC